MASDDVEPLHGPRATATVSLPRLKIATRDGTNFWLDPKVDERGEYYAIFRNSESVGTIRLLPRSAECHVRDFVPRDQLEDIATALRSLN